MKMVLYILTLGYLIVTFSPPGDASNIDLSLISDSAYTVGSPVKIAIVTNKPHDESVLVIKDSWGINALALNLIAGTNEVQLPTHLSKKAGEVELQVWLGAAMKQQTSLMLIPQATARPIPEVYTGPRFLLAGGADEAMMVATPLDSLDNPLADGTLVNYKIRGRAGDQQASSKISGLFTYHIFRSDLRTGIMTAHINCEQSNSPEYDFFVKSSAPMNFSITQDKLHQEADGQQLVRLSTDRITDSLDNTIVDGTTVRFMVRSSLGTYGQLSAPTINGVAMAEFPFPTESQLWTIEASIPGYATSNAIELTFEPSLGNLNASYDPICICLNIGPVSTSFGSLAADGTLIDVKLIGQNAIINLQTTMRLGLATLDLKSAKVPGGYYDIVLSSGGQKLVMKDIKVEV